MKRIVFSLMAVLAIFGCQVKEIDEFTPDSKDDSEAKVFIATIEDNASVATKTYLDEKLNVLWSSGDQVSIFAGNTVNQQYRVTEGSAGTTEAELNRVVAPESSGTTIDHNVAYYPYVASASLTKNNDNYVIGGITLPAVQNYASGSFGNGAFPMTAISSPATDLDLKFKNVLGGLKLQLTGTATIASISITGNSQEILCGAAEVTVFNGSVPSITLTDATAKTVTLDCGEGVQLNEENAVPFIIALPPMTMAGGFTVIVTDTEGGQMTIKTTKPQTITRSNLLKMPAVTYAGTAPEPEHQYVDLGLPSGLEWATCNVGANSPEDYGDYFAWGEIEPYYSSQNPLTWKTGKTAGYNWASYQWCNGSQNTLTKYNKYSSYGTVDNKTTLDLEDDAARANWGGNWRMPTDDNWTELRTKCTWTWTVQNGVNGNLVTGPNGNSIFLPAAGYRSGTSLNTDSDGGYWSSSLNSGSPDYAWSVYFDSANVTRDNYYRFLGQSVRPVTDEGVRVSGITLDRNALALGAGETANLSATITPANATQPTVIWTSDNTSVATVDDTGVVTAVSAGTATITATTYDGGFTATCTVTVFKPTTGTINGYEWVDLGLPSGLKWATCNVGATAPKEYGDYFAWGETAPYYTEGHSQDNPCSTWKDGKTAGYSWASYKFELGTGNNGPFSKYVTKSSYGSVDNKTVLDPEDDAASVNWGGNWRMPTSGEWGELIDSNNCTCTWTTHNGASGYLITSKKNGNSIFLPAAGYRNNTSLDDSGSYGYYWSSSLSTGDPYYAWHVSFNSAYDTREDYYRYLGQSVRPVTE